VSTDPHADPAHPPPEIIHVTARSGLPAEFTVEVNVRAAPSSSGISDGDTESEISLVTVTAAVALFELSAALVASTLTDAGTGRWCGAVYAPVASIVPMLALPPATPFTDHVTAVLVELLTVAVKTCGKPRSKEADAGAIATEMEEGGGGCDGA